MEKYLKKAPHHRTPLTIILICIIVLALAYAISVLFGSKGGDISDSNSALNSKDSILSAPNPRVTLTLDEAKSKQDILLESNAKVKLTPEQMKAKQVILEQN